MGSLCDERTELFPLSWCLLYPVNNMIMSNDKFMNLFYCVYTCFGLCFLFVFLALSFSVCFPTKWKGNKENEICSVTLLAEKELFFLRTVLSWVLFGYWEIQEKVRNKASGIFIFIFIFFCLVLRKIMKEKERRWKNSTFSPVLIHSLPYEYD